MNSYIFPRTIFKIIKSPSTQWKLKKRFPEILFLPHMKRDEFNFFNAICFGKNSFLEFGSGGSTIYFLKKNKLLYSVESNPDFFDFMKSIRIVQESIGRNLTYKYVDLGSTNKWGKPLNPDLSASWEEYYKNIWEDIDPRSYPIDVVFIDGRFRVCCCLYSLLKSIEYKWYDTTFLIHDFWKRKEYHIVLNFLEEIKSVRNLAMFKIRSDINIANVKSMLAANAFVTL